MDLTIARLKEEMEDVRGRGMESALLQFYGESAVAARLQALREASQHRAHMEGVSARLAEHGKEEAEGLLLGQSEVLKESLIEEMAGDLKSCQEELRAAQGLGGGGGGAGALPARTVLTRHLRKNKGGGDLWEEEEGSRGGGGRNGNGIGGNGGGCKRRRGPGVVNATFQRLLEEDEAEEDLHAITEDDRFALEEMEGVGMGREAAMPVVEVRIEKSGVYYDGMHLQKNDALVVTNARLRDSFLATLQSFNQTEIFVKVQGKALMPGDTLASSRKRISVEELKASKYVLGLPSSSHSSSPASSPSHFYGGQGTMPSSFAVAVGGDGSGRARGGGGRRVVR
jgi:hypothetical protein